MARSLNALLRSRPEDGSPNPPAPPDSRLGLSIAFYIDPVREQASAGFLHREAYLERDLEVADFAAFDVATGPCDLEPS
jgi:hypothetical protein